MSITSNAESRDDKALVKRHASLHDGATHDLKFLKRHVVVFDAEDASEARYTRKQYQDYLDALEAEQAGLEDATGDLPPQAAEPRSGFSTATAEIDSRIIDDISDLAFQVGVSEREDEVNKNSARFERGELMIRLAAVAQSERIPFKDILTRVNERMARRADENNLTDFQLITKEEATTTRRVVEAFGSHGEFRLVNYINPNTGQPLVGDDGEPPLTSIRSVPVNKLYAIVDYAGEKDLDALLSFAYRYNERVVKKVRSIAKNQGKSLLSIAKRLDKVKRDAVHMVTGETIKVQLDTKGALEKLRDWAGEAPPPDVVSIKTDRAWVESFFEPLKALYTAVMQDVQPELFPEGVSTVFVFERTIGQLFNVNTEEGVVNALRALVNAEDIDEDQAKEFYANHDFNPGTGQWEPNSVPPVDEDEDEVELHDYTDDDLDADFDDDDEGFEDVEA